MTLEQLRIFIAVAEREHLTQAAGSLALTPSAVSASLRALEQRYNTPLFNRIGRRIEINESGRLFLVAARATLAAARNAELTLAELTGLQRGTLAMHASQTIASYWLPPLLTQFRQRYPLIDLVLTIGNTCSVAQAVLQGAADLGFVESCINEPELATTKVADDSIVLVTGASHPWADGRPIDAPALLSAEWIMREQGSGTRSAFESRLAAMGVDAGKLHIALTLPSNEAVRSAVVAGRYVTVVSKLVVASHLQTGLLSQANFTLPPRRFSMLHHEQRNSSKAAQAFKQMLQIPDVLNAR
jgi:DNA-binding transcriptional LysR family regulator